MPKLKFLLKNQNNYEVAWIWTWVSFPMQFGLELYATTWNWWGNDHSNGSFGQSNQVIKYTPNLYFTSLQFMNLLTQWISILRLRLQKFGRLSCGDDSNDNILIKLLNSIQILLLNTSKSYTIIWYPQYGTCQLAHIN